MWQLLNSVAAVGLAVVCSGPPQQMPVEGQKERPLHMGRGRGGDILRCPQGLQGCAQSVQAYRYETLREGTQRV